MADRRALTQLDVGVMGVQHNLLLKRGVIRNRRIQRECRVVGTTIRQARRY